MVALALLAACPTSSSPDGGSTAGGSTAGGSTAGGSTAGGSTAGGSTAGGSTAGGSTAGGTPSDAGTDAGAPPPRFLYVITEVEDVITPSFGNRTNPAWRAGARAFASSTDASVGYTYGNGYNWNVIGPANAGTEWSVDGGLAYLSRVQAELNASTVRQVFLGLDIEGAIVPNPTQLGRAQPSYAGNLAAVSSVVTRFAARFGSAAPDGGKPLSFYGAAVGNTFYFSEAALRAYRSPTWPSGYPFDGGEFPGAWQWATVPMAAAGMHAVVGGGPLDVRYDHFHDGGRYPPAMGSFLREFGRDWMGAAYALPEWQPFLREQDVVAPSYYLVGGFPDVNVVDVTREDAGPRAGLSAEAAYQYEDVKALAEWIQANPDRPRTLVPYVSALMFFSGHAVGPSETRPPNASDFWDWPDWNADAGALWLDSSNTYVTSGQVRAPFPVFLNSLEGIQRGARAGGHPLDGIFLWDAYAWALGNARQYVANNRTQPGLAPFLTDLWRIIMTEWSLGLPGDAQHLAPLFGGTWDRRAVFGTLAAKPLASWTLQDVDDAILLVWKVRCEAYLRAAQTVLGT